MLKENFQCIILTEGNCVQHVADNRGVWCMLDSPMTCDTQALVQVGPSIPLDGDLGNLSVGQKLVVVDAP